MATTQNNSTLVSQEELNNLKLLDDRFKSLQTSAISLLGETQKLSKELSKSGSSYSELAKAMQSHDELQKKVTANQREQQKVLNDIDTVKKRVIQSETELTKRIEESTKVYTNSNNRISEAATRLAELQKAQNNVRTLMRELNNEFKQGTITEEAYIKAQAELIEAGSKIRTSITQTQAELRNLQKGYKDVTTEVVLFGDEVQTTSERVSSSVKVPRDLLADLERNLEGLSNRLDFSKLTEDLESGVTNVGTAFRAVENTITVLERLLGDYDEVLKKGLISQTEYAVGTSNLRKALQEAATVQEGFRKRLEATQKATKDQASQTDNSTASFNRNTASLEELREESKRLTTEFNNLDKTTRESHIGTELAFEINSLNEEIKGVESSLSDFDGRVKNFTSGLTGLSKSVSLVSPAAGKAITGVNNLNKAFLKLLANPIVAAIAAIVAVVTALVAIFVKAVSATAETEEGFSKLQKVMAPLRVIGDAIDKVFRNLGDTFLNVAGAVTGFIVKLSDMIGLTSDLNGQVEKYIRLEENRLSLVRQQRALDVDIINSQRNIAELREKIAQQDVYSYNERLNMIDKVIQLEAEQARKEEEFARQRLKNIYEEIRTRGLEGNTEWIEKEQQAFIQLQQLQTQSAQRQRSYQRERIQIIKQSNAEAESERKKELADQKKEAQNQSQLIQFRGQIEADSHKQILSDQKQGYLARLNAAEQYFTTMEKVIQEAARAQLEDETLTETQRTLIEEKANYEIVKLRNELKNNLLKIEQDNLKLQQAQADTARSQAIENLTLQQTEEETALARSYARGEIKKKEYETKKNEIQLRYIEERYQEEVNYLNSLAELYIDDEKEYEKYQRKLADINAKYAKMKADKEVEEFQRSGKQREDFERELTRHLQQLATQLNSTIFSLTSSRLERQLQALDAEMEANKKFYEEKLEDVEYSVERGLITEEYAADQRKYYAEQEKQRQEQLAEKKKELQLKQAKFEKAQAAIDVVLNTAVGIMAAWKNPWTAPVIVPIIAATGAAQLATVLAQPLPQYAEGTSDHPGGLAVVGDGGRSEMILTPSGSMFKTPAKPTLMNLPKHSEVLPDYYKALNGFDMGKFSPSTNTVILDDGKQVDLLQKSVDITLQAKRFQFRQQAELIKKVDRGNRYQKHQAKNSTYSNHLTH